MITLHDEKDILSLDYRRKIIQEITGTENVERKQRELKKHEVYKDRTKKHVIEELSKDFTPETVSMMVNRASNISFCRKIVDKSAKSYKEGVIRTVQKDLVSTEQISMLAEKMKSNSVLKKTDKYKNLFKNCLFQVMPEKDNVESAKTEGINLFKIKHRVLPPYKYDVIPDHSDQEKIRCVILTDFLERDAVVGTGPAEGSDGRDFSQPRMTEHRGDNREQTIANEPEDKGTSFRTFIWWSNEYHFTTDDKGDIIPEKSGEPIMFDQNGTMVELPVGNPIGMLPFVNFAEDQDGSFWAQGGEDLVDGSVLLNVMITDMLSIAYIQGWGQLVGKGKNLPATFRVGPQRAIVMEYDNGDPVPDLNYISSSPPLDQWMRMIEQYVALLLSTNNLSTRNIAGSLDANDVASGIAKIIDQSESTDDVTESQSDFQDKEPHIWFITNAWWLRLNEAKSLTDEFKEIGEVKDTNVVLRFPQQKPIVSESDKLENLKRRVELKLNEEFELIMMDDPSLSPDEAKNKLLRIKKEQLSRSINAFRAATQADDQDEQEDEELDGEGEL